eukprot:gb/GFBE01008541.1/.p1 GENE.gb/GFBE01008541.1/~~gb/GFBE01008541.1/.p1  ORF type:complete len:215 (+),score=31.68 gb/GFBE01008541.1/:1-645(+)
MVHRHGESSWQRYGRRSLAVPGWLSLCVCVMTMGCTPFALLGAGRSALAGRGAVSRQPMRHRRSVYSTYTDSVSGVILPKMDRDEPAWLSFVLSRYLDEEWFEQPVHQEIADAAASLYKDIRAAGHDELVTVMFKMVYGLQEMWVEAGFKEAFEAPWEVTNRVSELLMLRLGKEVFSHGAQNSYVQQRMLGRLRDYEAVRRACTDALGKRASDV